MTEQPLTEPEEKAAEALMDQAAANLRSHMNTALVANSSILTPRQLLEVDPL